MPSGEHFVQVSDHVTLQSTFGLVAIMSVVDGSVVSCSDTCAAAPWSIAAATRRTTRGALPADMNPKAVAEPSSASDALALRPGDDEDFVVEDDEDGGDDEDGEDAGGEGELPAARAMLQRPSAMQAHRHARAAVGAIG